MDVGREAAARGFGAEIAYYLEHHMEGRDRDSLEDLRDPCAERMDDALGVEGLARGRAAMMESLEFTPLSDVEPALAALRERGLRLVIASNWDSSLRCRTPGSTASSTEPCGRPVIAAAKPAPGIFRDALRVAGVGVGEALHAATRWRGHPLDDPADPAFSRRLSPA